MWQIRSQYELTCRTILKERKLTAKIDKRFDLLIILKTAVIRKAELFVGCHRGSFL